MTKAEAVNMWPIHNWILSILEGEKKLLIML